MTVTTKEILDEFTAAYERVQQSACPEPTMMNLATADKQGRPSNRVVLLKSFDEQGFVFYTNYQSRKGRELEGNPHAALAFLWYEFNLQVRIQGRVEKTTSEESDTYFATRPRQSQIGAWASMQSQLIGHKFAFEKRIAKYALKFAVGSVPRPDFWGGFRVIPDTVEFWQKKDFRLHQRRLFIRQQADEWSMQKIYP